MLSTRFTLLLAHLLIACALAADIVPASGEPKSEGCLGIIDTHIVYNCLLWPEQQWKHVVRSQLEHLVATGITECATVHIVLSTPAVHDNHTYLQLEAVLQEGSAMVRALLPRRDGTVTVTQVHENSFEYPGIHLLWLLGQVRICSNCKKPNFLTRLEPATCLLITYRLCQI